MEDALLGMGQSLATTSPLKMMKSSSDFTSKALIVLWIIQFLFWVFGQVRKRLDRKAKVSWKMYDVTNWIKNNSKHILPDISGGKSNQIFKFGQLIEYNMRNIFMIKSCTKCGG